MLILAISSRYIYSQAPTKEETIAFIKSCAQEAIGLRAMDGRVLTDIVFNYYKVEQELKYELTPEQTGNGKVHIYQKGSEEWPLIKWQNVSSIQILNCHLLENYGFCQLQIHFKLPNQKHIVRIDGLGDKNFDRFVDEYTHFIPISIHKNKLESVEKAVLRLSQIAKEENKDPFKN